MVEFHTAVNLVLLDVVLVDSPIAAVSDARDDIQFLHVDILLNACASYQTNRKSAGNGPKLKRPLKLLSVRQQETGTCGWFI